MLDPTWAVRPPVATDAPALFDLVAACDIAVLGHPDISLADVERDLSARPDLQLVVLDGERALAWVFVMDKAAGRTPVDVYVDPALDPDRADELAAWAWASVIDTARSVARARSLATTTIEVGVLDGDAVNEKRVTTAGLEHVRVFWRMSRPLSAADARPPLPEGVSLRGVELPAEAPLLYDLIETAFVDHWGHARRTYDEWLAARTDPADFDPTLWWLAEVDGHPAGLLIATTQMADEDAIYIGILGTLEEFRGRGVGTALLHQAFAAGLARGWSLARLNVDSDSSTGAPRVYAAAGLEVEFAMHAWSLELSAEGPV